MAYVHSYEVKIECHAPRDERHISSYTRTAVAEDGDKALIKVTLDLWASLINMRITDVSVRQVGDSWYEYE